MNRSLLETPFPPHQIKQRQGAHGLLDYIEGHAVIQRLNDAFESCWSFEIVRQDVREDLDEVVILGRLVAGEVIKTQFGSSRIARNRETGKIICLGDDLKAAATDALKKAGTLLGVGLHLYGDPPPEQASNPPVQPPAARTSGRTTAEPPGSGRCQEGNRLSQKQHQLILKLAGEGEITRAELNHHCQQHYGRVLDFLTRANASHLIDALFAGKVKAA